MKRALDALAMNMNDDSAMDMDEVMAVLRQAEADGTFSFTKVLRPAENDVADENEVADGAIVGNSDEDVAIEAVQKSCKDEPHDCDSEA